ncbi:TonB-dependent receptor [Stakelama sp. CBK3Z-3]|uniref:TonB-dependent receptor n=1 Tax=Stakelama flava TaxID=2860338 RepID=A0ABS6XLH2_9SPHN|nr:TonB-dependent receptor [Stakelama flava]MBW4331064.1 TonB-dependent receptor [Stakelama flava]
MTLRLLLLATLPIYFWSGAAWAQAIPGAEIVVEGEGLPPPPGDAAYSTLTIDHDRLGTLPSGRLEEAFADVAGLESYRRSDSQSAHPTSQGVTLRGLGGNASSRVLLLLDGVPQSDPFGGWVAFPAYLPDTLARLRVTRGGGSGLQGPGALAGTIEMTSAGPDLLPALTARADYGSRDSLDTALYGASEAGNGFVAYGASYRRGDGFIPVAPEDRGAADIPAYYEQGNASLRAGIDVDDATQLQASVRGFVDRRGGGTAYTGIRSEGADASIRAVGSGDWQWQALAYLQTRNLASGFASVSDDRSSASPALDQYQVPSTGIGGRVEIAPPLGGGWNLRIGGDVRNVTGRTEERYIFSGTTPTRRRRAGGTSRTLGGFADLGYQAGPLTLDAGGRIDFWRIGTGTLFEQAFSGGAPITDARYAPRHGSEVTGRLGAAYRVAPLMTVRAAAYRGWRLPTLNELYRPYRVGSDATAANALLDPEHLSGAEIGVDVAAGPFARLSATVFHNRLSDAIANVTLGQGAGTFPGVGYVSAGGAYRQRRNLDAVTTTGAEVALHLNLGEWRLDAGYAYTDPRVDATGEAAPLDGLRPAQTARHHANATIGWGAADGLNASATLRYTGAQFEDDLNSTRLDPAVTLSGAVQFPVSNVVAVRLRGENITDTRVEAGIDGDGITELATPRTLWAGISVTLG